MAVKRLRDTRTGNGRAKHTSPRCYWLVPEVLSLTVAGVLSPDVAIFGLLLETEALVDG